MSFPQGILQGVAAFVQHLIEAFKALATGVSVDTSIPFIATVAIIAFLFGLWYNRGINIGTQRPSMNVVLIVGIIAFSFIFFGDQVMEILKNLLMKLTGG